MLNPLRPHHPPSPAPARTARAVGRCLAALVLAWGAVGGVAWGQGTAVAPRAQATALDPLVVFSGPPGGFGALEVYDRTTGGRLSGAGRLRDLQLLTIDHAGRTELEALLVGSPRRRVDLAGDAARLELPHGQGTLVRYRRAEAGALRYGFLVVRPGAFPRVLLERPAAGALDPFVGKIGVAPDGRALLVATTLAAGGDLFEVPVAGGPIALRTLLAPPRDFSADSLWLGATWGFAIAPDGAWRFSRATGAEALLVAAQGAGTWTGQAVMSRARTAALATAGAGPLALDAWAFGPTGPALRVSTAPAAIEPAGFEPEHAGGPWMAISDDGALAGWVERSSGPLGPFRDVRLTEVRTALPGVLVTGDLFLTDTLDEVGRMLFARPTELVYAAGEANVPAEGGLESADFFGARPGAGGPQLRNLSATSGQVTATPFTSIPTMTPARAYLVDGDRMLFHDDDAAALRVLDLVGGTLTTVEGDVKELDWLEPVEAGFVAAVRRDAQPRPRDLLGISLGGAVQMLRHGSPALEYRHPVSSGPWLAWTERLLTQDTLHRLDASTSAIETWSTTPSPTTAPLDLRRDGGVTFGFGAGTTGIQTRVWRTAGADIVLRHTLRPGHVLP